MLTAKEIAQSTDDSPSSLNYDKILLCRRQLLISHTNYGLEPFWDWLSHGIFSPCHYNLFWFLVSPMKPIPTLFNSIGIFKLKLLIDLNLNDEDRKQKKRRRQMLPSLSYRWNGAFQKHKTKQVLKHWSNNSSRNTKKKQSEHRTEKKNNKK